MTDITELAQREKFEAWWEREYKHLESSKYTDAVPHIKYGFWMAYQAGGAELVEALEKAQRANAAQDDHINQQQDRIESLEKKNDELGKYAGKLETINAAAEKLVRCKGRYHSEQNYRALAALFGVTTPDLPPLDGESRTVKLPDLRQIVSGDRYVWSDGVYNYSQDVKAALAAAGIKWEAD